MKPSVQEQRCPICDWPMASSAEKGCVPGDCSYRPDDPAEQRRISERRKALSSVSTPAQDPDAGLPTADDVRGIIPRSTPAQDATALADKWRAEAATHITAALEEEDIGCDDWFLHRETARIYERCAKELAALRTVPQTPDADHIGEYIADYSPLTAEEIAQEDPELTALYARSTPSASAGPQAEALASKIENWSPESRHPLTLIARERRQIAAALRAQPQQADGRDAVIELAAWLCALEDAECHKPVPESLIEHGRRYIHAGMTEKHCGDCTNESHSCVVCGTDGYLLHARQIRAALSATDGPAK